MTSQMAIFLKRAMLKNGLTFFHNSMYILGYCEEQLYDHHAHVSGTKNDFPPITVFLRSFDPYDVTNGHFSQKGHPQTFSQLYVYPRMLRRTIFWQLRLFR